MRNTFKMLFLAALFCSAPLAASANTPSISGTTIPSASQIIDAQHNVWTLSGGKVYENGKVTPSGGVILLLCNGSAIFQENSQHNWWVWGVGGWAPSHDPRVVSPNGTSLPTAPQLVDSQLDIWTLSNGQAYEKGQLTPSSGVILLVYANGAVYQENLHQNWWRWESGKWVATTAPRYPSPSGTTVPSATEIVDEQSGVWTLSGGRAYRDDVATLSSSVILLLSYEGSIYQENAHHNWYRWNSSTWVAAPTDPRAGQPMVYVGNDEIFSVSVVDSGTNRVVNTVSLGFAPESMVVTPDAKHVYVAGGDGHTPGTTVAVMETAHNTIAAKLTLPSLSNTMAMAASPDGKRVYVVFDQMATLEVIVYVIDTATNALVATIDTGTQSDIIVAFGISPDGKKLYVPTSGMTLVIDTTTNQVVSHIAIPNGGGMDSAVLSPDGTKLYTDATLPYYYYVWNAVFNPATGALEKTIPQVMSVQTFSPDGRHLYGSGLALYLGGVAVIDTTTNAACTAIVGIDGPFAITPDGRHLYVADYNGNVSVADTTTYTVSTVISGFALPISIAIVPAPPISP